MPAVIHGGQSTHVSSASGVGSTVPVVAHPQRVLLIAHRGYSAVAPENTVPAMRAAARAGADLVEFDVQRTSDGHLIVIHDDTFARTTNVAKVFPGRESDPVGSFTLAEVRQLDAGSWMSPRYAGTRVPTLDDVLAAVHPTHTGILLELKNPSLYPGYEAQVVTTMRHEGFIGHGRAFVHSFDARSLALFHQLAPSVPLGLITDNSTGPAPASVRVWLGTVNPDTTTVTDPVVDADQAHHLQVFAWPPSTHPATASQIERLVDDGVNGIITDNPVLTRQEIAAAGAATT